MDSQSTLELPEAVSKSLFIRVVVCPALVLPGNSVPGWTISRDPGKPGKYKFVAVYINNWQQTPTFLTFCIQTQ